ncbi:hypothetical protein, variant 2 [Exophiala mesophila]|nr:hypothetical protein, variant 1 [Exophiala mesophila]XP_016227512.1 hypothetical protein, variant 2 [Exophiala mesophila]KIV95937.1 hypothetical protein, variant 1 [Exophiala mesophila]KIV95938.1 hypothetical protein, variant 2 [Exophiala mesophila]
MLAVGVLVPLDHGRIGRIWLHGQGLKDIARSQIQDVQNTSKLEDFWNQNKLEPGQDTANTPAESSDQLSKSRGYQKSQSMSSGTHFISSHHTLTPYHPATTLLESLKLFGPLIFPVFRASLLRQKILIVTDAPVEFTCNLVYNLSILSSISPQTSSASGIPDAFHSKLRPLYTIGVSDITSLQEDARDRNDAATTEQGWVACTTDDVLSTKPELYDLLVLMPPSQSQQSHARAFPKIVRSSPSLDKNFPRNGLKATQRDLHRYLHLQQGLGQFEPSHVTNLSKPSSDDDNTSILSVSSTYSTHRTVVESTSWSRVAYTSLVWWASAGDRRSGLAELEEMEAEHDLSLLQDEGGNEDETREVALVAYFHRMTRLIFQTIAEAIARADGLDGNEDSYHDEDDPSEDGSVGDDTTSTDQEFSGEQDETQALLQKEEEQPVVEISQEDMVMMGLDTWSASDKQFIEELTMLWWGRQAHVRAATVECCGLRIL